MEVSRLIPPLILIFVNTRIIKSPSLRPVSSQLSHHSKCSYFLERHNQFPLEAVSGSCAPFPPGALDVPRRQCGASVPDRNHLWPLESSGLHLIQEHELYWLKTDQRDNVSTQLLSTWQLLLRFLSPLISPFSGGLYQFCSLCRRRWRATDVLLHFLQGPANLAWGNVFISASFWFPSAWKNKTQWAICMFVLLRWGLFHLQGA